MIEHQAEGWMYIGGALGVLGLCVLLAVGLDRIAKATGVWSYTNRYVLLARAAWRWRMRVS